jgi:amidophosphoribosyltransferase
MNDPDDNDHFHDECGVFGIIGHPDAAAIASLGLHALQHRGQESAGIATADGRDIHLRKHMGLVAAAFPADVIKTLPGTAAIGHVRYSTAGDSTLLNAQPMKCLYAHGAIAIAHNGNLVNTGTLRQQLMARGHLFQSTSDSEILLQLVASHYSPSLQDRVAGMMTEARGAYSVVVLTQDQMAAARDPYGFRPLVLGRLDGAPVVASETTSLDLIGATYEREIEPGEVFLAGPDGESSIHPVRAPRLARCVFEQIYFARPDSVIFGRQVNTLRTEFGRQLARECPVPDADVVIPVPDSGTPAAIGFSQQSGVPFAMGLIRSHYVGRTFIQPEQKIRHLGVKLKLSPVGEVMKDRVVVVVDDSIVRGTTSRKIVEMLRSRGARAVHLRISSPPTRWPCYYGIDTPSRNELIAARIDSLDEIARELTADSIAYLSAEGVHQVVSGGNGDGYCDACFTGNYPVPVENGYSPRGGDPRPDKR